MGIRRCQEPEIKSGLLLASLPDDVIEVIMRQLTKDYQTKMVNKRPVIFNNPERLLPGKKLGKMTSSWFNLIRSSMILAKAVWKNPSLWVNIDFSWHPTLALLTSQSLAALLQRVDARHVTKSIKFADTQREHILAHRKRTTVSTDLSEGLMPLKGSRVLQEIDLCLPRRKGHVFDSTQVGKLLTTMTDRGPLALQTIRYNSMSVTDTTPLNVIRLIIAVVDRSVHQPRLDLPENTIECKPCEEAVATGKFEIGNACCECENVECPDCGGGIRCVSCDNSFCGKCREKDQGRHCGQCFDFYCRHHCMLEETVSCEFCASVLCENCGFMNYCDRCGIFFCDECMDNGRHGPVNDDY